MKKRTLIQWLGLLGIVSLLSYTAAVLFAPSAYPGYDWVTQAVSDLSAQNAPSRMLWDRLTALYEPCGIAALMLSLLYVQGKLNRLIRIGIDLFVIMNWISAVGYAMFPLSDSGYAGTFTDIMHVYVITAPVVALSVASLTLIIIGGFRKRQCISLAVWGCVALGMMLAGAVGTSALPQIFGVMERFSLFAATGFTAVLGVYLFNGFAEKQAYGMSGKRI